MKYTLGAHVLDVGTRTLSGPDGPIHIEPQVFDVLHVLVQHRDRAVSKEELLDTVWGDQFVSESALTSRIRSARSALGDDGQRQALIRTSHGFGYQFVGPVTEESRDDETTITLGRRAQSVQLPHFGTQFRGRDQECAELSRHVATHPLITVVGPGGTGKTRLAVEVASRSADEDLALPRAFVDLTTVRDEADVATFVVESIGIRADDPAHALDAAAEFLSAVPHLVVLDNCEHVAGAAADAASRISAGAPEARILATSREPLGITGERVFRLGTLPVLSEADLLTPEQVERNPAAGLFVDRARQLDHSFQPTASDARQIVELSRSLDGLPLALELAAGRVATFGLDEVVARLDQRLDLLRDRGSARDARHRTLRATVEWSYNSLDDDQQRVLRAFSAFPSGATLDTIEWLAFELGCAESGIDIAADLVDVSLLQRVAAPSGTRFTQLETLRAFGLDRLDHHGERDSALDLAARRMCSLIGELRAQMRSTNEPIWVDRIDREFANIRAVRAHLAQSGQWEMLLDMAVGLNSWARMRDAAEVWGWSDGLEEHFRGGPEMEHGRTLALLAQAEWRRGRFEASASTALAALDATDDDWTVAHALAELGVARLFGGDFPAAVDCWRRSNDLIGDPVTLCSASIAAAYAGERDLSADFLARGEAVAKEHGNPSWLAWVAYARAETGLSFARRDDPDLVPGNDVIACLQRAIDLSSAVGSSFIEGVAKVTLAGALADRGEATLAAQTYHDLIEHWLRSGGWTQMWTTLRRSAELLADTDPDMALLLLRAADADVTSSALAPEAAELYSSLTADLISHGADAQVALPDRARVADFARSALAARSGG